MAISFDYGQRHKIELQHAAKICQFYGIQQKIVTLPTGTLCHSALLSDMNIQKNRDEHSIEENGIPNTYVPARNTIFLAYATALAEIWEAEEIYFGANLLDRKPYPDCRPAFVEAFQQVINVATKQAAEAKSPKIIAPLIDWDKKRIVEEAKSLGVPIEMTFSCYDPSAEGTPCKTCDACYLRQQALGT